MADVQTREVPFAEADAFLEGLVPGGRCLSARFPNEWIFRGHADATWKLLPSALRDCPLPVLLDRELGWSDHLRTTWQELEVAEANTTARFFWLADQFGLALPEDSQQLRDHLLHAPRPGWSIDVEHWPPSEFRSVLALAQHYGIPTRLLDWTWEPLHAAYFAAVKAATWQPKPKAEASHVASHLAVWGFNLDAYSSCYEVPPETRRFTRHPDLQPVSIVTAPTAGNPNLRSQRGVFLLGRWAHKGKFEIVRTPIDELVYSGLKEWMEMDVGWVRPAIPSGLFVKFLLPTTEAPRLLRLLAQRGVCGGSIYPGFGGIADALREEMNWDNKGWLPPRH